MRQSPRSLLLPLLVTATVISAVLCWFGWLLLTQRRESARRSGGRPSLFARPVDRVESQFERIEIAEYLDRRWTPAAGSTAGSRRMITRACAPAR